MRPGSEVGEPSGKQQPDAGSEGKLESCLGCSRWLALVLLAVGIVGAAVAGAMPLALVLTVVAVVVWLLGRSLERRAHQRWALQVAAAQRARNERARRALLRVRSGQALLRPLFVYLRPFAGAQYDLHLGSLGIFSGSSSVPRNKGLEAGLSTLVAPFGDFVALGRDLEALGAGHVAIGDDEWQTAVRRLCEAATGVLMFPSATPGTTWEMLLLAERRLLSKTIFFMPPLVVAELTGALARLAGRDEAEGEADEAHGAQRASARAVRIVNETAPADWDGARTHYSGYGIELPAFDELGQAFVLEEDRRSVALCPLSVRLAEWRTFVDKKLQQELRARLARISRELDTDPNPVLLALNAPANQHLLPLIAHLSTLVERSWQAQLSGS